MTAKADRDNLIRRHKLDGMTGMEIAKMFKCDPRTIAYRLKAMGLQDPKRVQGGKLGYKKREAALTKGKAESTNGKRKQAL